MRMGLLGVSRIQSFGFRSSMSIIITVECKFKRATYDASKQDLFAEIIKEDGLKKNSTGPISILGPTSYKTRVFDHIPGFLKLSMPMAYI